MEASQPLLQEGALGRLALHAKQLPELRGDAEAEARSLARFFRRLHTAGVTFHTWPRTSDNSCCVGLAEQLFTRRAGIIPLGVRTLRMARPCAAGRAPPAGSGFSTAMMTLCAWFWTCDAAERDVPIKRCWVRCGERVQKEGWL